MTARENQSTSSAEGTQRAGRILGRRRATSLLQPRRTACRRLRIGVCTSLPPIYLMFPGLCAGRRKMAAAGPPASGQLEGASDADSKSRRDGSGRCAKVGRTRELLVTFCSSRACRLLTVRTTDDANASSTFCRNTRESSEGCMQTGETYFAKGGRVR